MDTESKTVHGGGEGGGKGERRDERTHGGKMKNIRMMWRGLEKSGLGWAGWAGQKRRGLDKVQLAGGKGKTRPRWW